MTNNAKIAKKIAKTQPNLKAMKLYSAPKYIVKITITNHNGQQIMVYDKTTPEDVKSTLMDAFVIAHSTTEGTLFEYGGDIVGQTENDTVYTYGFASNSKEPINTQLQRMGINLVF